MLKLLAALAFVALSAASAWAQSFTMPPPAGVVVLGCVYNTTPPTLTNGQTGFYQCSANGQGVTTSGPYSYTPLTPGQHNLALTSSTALTVPTGSTYATICASGNAVKYTTDGTTTPTSGIGQPLAIGQCVSLSGPTVLANFRAIQTASAATLDVEYFK